jgi:3'-phosphoadenosine 5'-phosphosulfate sulfotransferase (PAPS reductase)/FAD synthetase
MTTNTHRLKSGITVYSDPYGVTLQHFSKDSTFTLHLKLTAAEARELTRAMLAALHEHTEMVPA